MYIATVGIVQTTTPSTIAPTTTTTLAPVTAPPVPTKPTPFVPCDPSCHDKARDCPDYNKADCQRADYAAFFKANCAEYCEYCTPISRCEQN